MTELIRVGFDPGTVERFAAVIAASIPAPPAPTTTIGTLTASSLISILAPADQSAEVIGPH